MRERRVSPFLCKNPQQQQQQHQHQHPISGCHGFPRTLLVLLLILLLSPDAGCFWVSDAFSLGAAGLGRPAAAAAAAAFSSSSQYQQRRMPMMKMKMKRTTKNDQNEDEDDDGSNSSSSFYSMIRKNTETWKRSLLASGLAASTIALATATSPLPATAATAAPFPEKSVVELSRGAIVIQTASSPSSSSDGNSNNINSPFIKSSSSMTDSKKLLQTLFQNRKEISASVGRIQSAINQELAREPSVWKELQKEFLSVEGDLASMVQVLPPSDWKATIQDVSAGKLNLVVNGELVNIQVLPNLGEREDDLLISIKGFKGNNDVFQFANTKSSSSSSSSAAAAGPQYGPIRSYFSKYEVFWSWWATPYPPQYLLPNMQASNGDVVLVGTAATIWLVYLSSYMYYEYEIEQERLAAEEKRLKIAAAGATAAAAKKKNEAAAAAAATSTTTNTKEKGKDKDKTNEDTASTTSTTAATTTSTKATKKKRRLGGLLFWRKK